MRSCRRTTAPRSRPKPDDDEEPEDTKTVFKVPVGKSPVRGPAGAPVTIVEFADYQCPFCVRAEATLRELRADYGDKLRWVFKNEPLPFHNRAEPAAEAALEVRAEKGDAAFWSVHDSMLDGERDLSDEALVGLAVAAGARADKVQAAIAKHSHAAEIDVDRDAAEDLRGERHAPLLHQRPPPRRSAAQGALRGDHRRGDQEGAGLVDAGTKPEAVYDALTKDGKGPPEPERVAVEALPAGDPARGPASARVTVHEFADFECPFCGRAEDTLKVVAKTYGDRVRFVWHDLPLPFHEHALPAATAAREAQKQKGDAAFWKLHDTLLADANRSSLEAISTPTRRLSDST